MPLLPAPSAAAAFAGAEALCALDSVRSLVVLLVLAVLIGHGAGAS